MKYCEIDGTGRNCVRCLWGYLGQPWPQCPDAVDTDEAAETLDEIAAKVRELHASLAARKKGA